MCNNNLETIQLQNLILSSSLNSTPVGISSVLLNDESYISISNLSDIKIHKILCSPVVEGMILESWAIECFLLDSLGNYLRTDVLKLISGNAQLDPSMGCVFNQNLQEMNFNKICAGFSVRQNIFVVNRPSLAEVPAVNFTVTVFFEKI